MKITGKLLSLMVTLCVVLALLSAGALAAGPVEVGDMQALESALSAGGSIKLTDSIALTGPLSIAQGKSVTLDLNGKALTWGGSLGAGAAATVATTDTLLTNAGTLTITDGAGGGRIELVASASGAYKKTYTMTAIENSGALTISGGTVAVENTNTAPGYAYTYGVSSSGTFSMTGGAVTLSASGSSSSGYAYAILSSGGAELSAGSVSATMSASTTAGRCYGLRGTGSTVISGGTISAENGGSGGTVYGIDMQKGDFSMKGGTVLVTGPGSVYGLYFMADVAPKTVSGGTVNTVTTSTSSLAYAVYAASGDSLPISGGSFSAVSATENRARVATNAIITGGEFNLDPSALVKQGTHITSATGANTFSYGSGGTYTYRVSPDPNPVMVAKTGGQSYASLQDAFDAAAAGGTVELLGDVDTGSWPTYIRAGVTLDMKGFDITAKSNVFYVSGGTEAQPVIITDSTATGFADAGTIRGSIAVNVGSGWTRVSKVNITTSSTGYSRAFMVEGASDARANLVVDGVNVSVTGTGTNTTGGICGMYIYKYADVTVNDGAAEFPTAFSVTASSTSHSGYIEAFHFITALCDLEVNGGSYTVTNAGASGKACLLDSNSSCTASVNIKGGKFSLSAATPLVTRMTMKNAVLSGGYYNFSPSSNLAPGCAAVEDSTYGGYGYKVLLTPLANIGGTDYYTLQTAMDATAEGGSITLLRDVVESAAVTVGKSVSIVNGSYTVTLNGSPALIEKGGVTAPEIMTENREAMIEESGGDTRYYTTFSQAASGRRADETVTLRKNLSTTSAYGFSCVIDLNGHSITSTATSGFAFNLVGATLGKSVHTMSITNSSLETPGAITGGININARGESYRLTIGENVAITAKQPLFIQGNGEAGSVQADIYGSLTATESTAAIQGNGTAAYSGTVINIYDGAVISGITTAIYHPQDGELNIYGGTISGGTGVYIKSGTLSITGGDIRGTGAFAEPQYNGSGASGTGDALIIDSCGYPGGAPGVSIEGGTFTSANGCALRECMTDGTTPARELAVTGGSFTGAAGKLLSATLTGFVTGGTYSADPTAYVPEGYRASKLTESSFKVAKVPANRIESADAAVKTAGGEPVENEAVDAVISGSVIALSGRISAANSITVTYLKTDTGTGTIEVTNSGTAFEVSPAVVTVGGVRYTVSTAGLSILPVEVKVEPPVAKVETLDTDGITDEAAKENAEAVNTALSTGTAAPTASGALAAAVVSDTVGTSGRTNEATVKVEGEKKPAAEVIAENTDKLPAEVTGAITDENHAVVVVQPIIKVAVVEATATTVTLDVSAMSQVVVTTKDVVESGNIITESGIQQNAIPVGEPTPVRVNTPVTITLPIALPESIVGVDGANIDSIFVRHVHDGKAEIVKAIYTPASGGVPATATFTVNGLSTIEFLADARTCTIDFKDGGAETYRLNSATAAFPEADAPSGQRFTGWKLTDSNGQDIAGAEEIYTAMSESLLTALDGKLVTATAQFEDIPPAATYTITIEPTEHGTVTSDMARAAKGAAVALTITPDEGYELDTLTVMGRDGIEVEAAEGAFTMPGTAVTVTAVFRERTFPFDDVTQGSWYYDAVRYMWEHGLMDGTDERAFSPAATVSRGMIVTVLWRIEGEPEAADAGFTDLTADWYRTAVNWAADEKIVEGEDDGKYAPAKDLTREQMATILCRYAEYRGYDVSAEGELSGFTDAADISSWAVAGVKWAVAEGLMDGMDGGLFAPGGNANRAQLAAVLMRLCENVMK